MKARALFQAGRLDEAIEALGVELRDNPADVQRRTFLFELLCFAGKFDRAEKQLDVLAKGGSQAALGALLYRTALHAERTRQEMFAIGELPTTGGPPPRPVSGTLNGTPFSSLTDADPRVGARLEVFAAGQYTWLPLEQLASIEMEQPKQLRDLMWAPVVVKPGEDFSALDIGEIMLPVLAPLSWQHPDGAVRLGRVTEWRELRDGAEAPVGQKLLLVDGEEFPILEVRRLEITPPPPAPAT